MSAAFTFTVLEVSAERRAATPTLRFRMRVHAADDDRIDAMVLRVHVQIEPERRGYTAGEQSMLNELFGSCDDRFVEMRPLLWYEGAASLEGFSGEADFNISVPCTYDAYVAASRYVNALDDGEIPVRLLLSGTAFLGDDGEVRAEVFQAEADGRVNVQTWHDAMDARFPKQAWIRLDHATFDALCRYRAEHALMDWESTFAHLLGVKQ